MDFRRANDDANYFCKERIKKERKKFEEREITWVKESVNDAVKQTTLNEEIQGKIIEQASKCLWDFRSRLNDFNSSSYVVVLFLLVQTLLVNHTKKIFKT